MASAACHSPSAARAPLVRRTSARENARLTADAVRARLAHRLALASAPLQGRRTGGRWPTRGRYLSNARIHLGSRTARRREDLLDYANPDHNSASRVRFCPPPQRTFGVPPRGFFLRPTGMDSTYSRPVLAARGNLGAARSSVKAGGWALTGIAGFPVDPPLVPRCSARKPFRHFDRISVRGNRTRSSARGRRGSGAATQLSAAPAVRSSSTASVSL